MSNRSGKGRCVSIDCRGWARRRGLCLSCYRVIARDVAAGMVTWRELEVAGMALEEAPDPEPAAAAPRTPRSRPRSHDRRPLPSAWELAAAPLEAPEEVPEFAEVQSLERRRAQREWVAPEPEDAPRRGRPILCIICEDRLPEARRPGTKSGPVELCHPCYLKAVEVFRRRGATAGP